jgi:DNA repair ATPase RecN
MTTPAQIAELTHRLKHETWSGFQNLAVQASTAITEQATEIAELKAKLADAIQDAHREARELDRVNEKLAEVMPLAKFGATVLRTYAHNGDINEEQVYNAAMQTNCMHATKAFTVLSPNTVDTIIKLLKD